MYTWNEGTLNIVRPSSVFFPPNQGRTLYLATQRCVIDRPTTERAIWNLDTITPRNGALTRRITNDGQSICSRYSLSINRTCEEPSYLGVSWYSSIWREEIGLPHPHPTYAYLPPPTSHPLITHSPFPSSIDSHRPWPLSRVRERERYG